MTVGSLLNMLDRGRTGAAASVAAAERSPFVAEGQMP